MHTKPAISTEADFASTLTVMHTLLEELITEELKRVAVEVIREHRRRLQKAQQLFEEISRLKGTPDRNDRLRSAQHDYCIAILGLHGQHQVVSVVVDRLGFVPNVDTSSPAMN